MKLNSHLAAAVSLPIMLALLATTAPALGQVPFIPGLVSPQPTYSNSTAQALRAQNEWIPIPYWLAGTWKASQQLIVYSYDYRLQRSVIDDPVAIKIQRMSVVGTQSDITGRIWHLPNQRVTVTESYVEIQQMDLLQLLKSSEDEVKVRCYATVTRRNRATGEIIDTFREETITTYSQLQDGLMQVSFAVTDYDMQNIPTHTSRSVCTEIRVKPFKAIDSDERGDLRQRFIDFINLRGVY